MGRASLGGAARKHTPTVRLNDAQIEHLTTKYGSTSRGLLALVIKDMRENPPLEPLPMNLPEITSVALAPRQTISNEDHRRPIDVQERDTQEAALTVIAGGKSTGHRHKPGEKVGERVQMGVAEVRYRCSVEGCGALLPWRRA